MSDKSCNKCARFQKAESRCTRLKDGKNNGVKVLRPDLGACLYFTPIEEKANEQKTEKKS